MDNIKKYNYVVRLATLQFKAGSSAYICVGAPGLSIPIFIIKNSNFNYIRKKINLININTNQFVTYKIIIEKLKLAYKSINLMF